MVKIYSFYEANLHVWRYQITAGQVGYYLGAQGGVWEDLPLGNNSIREIEEFYIPVPVPSCLCIK